MKLHQVWGGVGSLSGGAGAGKLFSFGGEVDGSWTCDYVNWEATVGGGAHGTVGVMNANATGHLAHSMDFYSNEYDELQYDYNPDVGVSTGGQYGAAVFMGAGVKTAGHTKKKTKSN